MEGWLATLLGGATSACKGRPCSHQSRNVGDAPRARKWSMSRVRPITPLCHGAVLAASRTSCNRLWSLCSWGDVVIVNMCTERKRNTLRETNDTCSCSNYQYRLHACSIRSSENGTTISHQRAVLTIIGHANARLTTKSRCYIFYMDLMHVKIQQNHNYNMAPAQHLKTLEY